MGFVTNGEGFGQETKEKIRFAQGSEFDCEEGESTTPFAVIKRG
jgi:hypothetical protein